MAGVTLRAGHEDEPQWFLADAERGRCPHRMSALLRHRNSEGLRFDEFFSIFYPYVSPPGVTVISPVVLYFLVCVVLLRQSQWWAVPEHGCRRHPWNLFQAELLQVFCLCRLCSLFELLGSVCVYIYICYLLFLGASGSLCGQISCCRRPFAARSRPHRCLLR